MTNADSTGPVTMTFKEAARMAVETAELKQGLAEKRAERAEEALKTIVKWEWALDGRKFNGNHKEVLRTVICDIAKPALRPTSSVKEGEKK